MRERPIIFSGPMVNALLLGTKTQTRRVVKYVPVLGEPRAWCATAAAEEPGWVHIVGDYRRFCPYGDLGSRIWIRETWQEVDDEYGSPLMVYRAGGYRMIGATNARHNPIYSSFDGEAGEFEHPEKWRSPIYMPRWASRITLEITGVRVHRLQDISEEDAKAEGIAVDSIGHAIRPGDDISWGGPRCAYAELWDSINAKRAPWHTNPWVWVITFKRVET